MKVAFLTPSLSRTAGGIFEIERGLAQALHDCPETTVEAFGLRDECTAQDASLWGAIGVKAYDSAGPRKFGYSPELRRAFLACHADIAHLHALWTYSSIVINAWHRKHRRPYVTTLNGMLDPWAVQNSALKKRLATLLYERRCLGEAACVQVNSESELNAARSFGLRNAIAVIPNGVVLPEVGATAAPAADDAVAAAKSEGRKILLYLGRLHPKKGLTNLIHALAQLGADNHEWLLTVVGWSQLGHAAELEALATSLKLGPRIVFLGPQHGAMKDLRYRQADAFILPSYSEGLPITVLEAWSYAKSVLMTPACNLPIGFDADAAISIEPETDSVAQGLRLLFRMSDAERAAMGRNGRRLAEERFSWTKVAQEMRVVYDWLLYGGARPDAVVLS